MTPHAAPHSAEPAATGSSAAALFQRKARSFAAASRFLSAEQAERSMRLYEFCRYVDDLADVLPPQQAKEELEQVLDDLRRGSSQRPVVQRFLSLAQECGIDPRHAIVLVLSLRQDVTPPPVCRDADLLRYAYGVAATVGLMMCPVLGVRDTAAEPFAVDLGIAMQITNIVRDVREDALRGRVYLPNADAAPFTMAELLDAERSDPTRVTAAMLAALDLAERYYQSAAQGYGFIPPAARAAIAVAGRLYREIGNQVRLDPLAAMKRRTIVSPARKALLTAGVVRDLASGAFAKPAAHDASLHAALRGLPGASSEQRESTGAAAKG